MRLLRLLSCVVGWKRSLVLVVPLLAGCVTTSAPAATTGPATHTAPPALVAPTWREPVLLSDEQAVGGEPNVVATSADHVFAFVSDHLFRSVDGGATFQKVGVKLDGGEGDADLAADDHGDVFFAGLYGDGTSIPFQVSHDDGLTWSAPFDLAAGEDQVDRQWVDASPNGTVYVTWHDQVSGQQALLFRRSFDAGATWSAPVVVAKDVLQGPLVHDPASGALYTIQYDGGLQVVRSLDQGASWTLLNVTREDRPLDEGYLRAIDEFPSIAVDDAGTVYAVWSQDDAGVAKDAAVPGVHLSVSKDRGQSWSKPLVISPVGHAAVLPWISAGAAGRVVATWYENEHGAPNEVGVDAWDVAAVESVDADGPMPTWVEGHANKAPVHVGSICTDGGNCDGLCSLSLCETRYCVNGGPCAGRDRSRADFFENAIRPNGQPVVVWMADASAQGVVETGTELYAGGATSGTPLS
jgi:hypothetical protein